MQIKVQANYSVKRESWRINLNTIRLREGNLRGFVALGSQLQELQGSVVNYNDIHLVLFYTIQGYAEEQPRLKFYLYEPTGVSFATMEVTPIHLQKYVGVYRYLQTLMKERWVKINKLLINEGKKAKKV